MCDYILEKEKAELIQTNMVRGSSYLMAKQLEATCSLNYRVEYPVAHFCISFSPEEKPKEETVKKISQYFLEEMGFNNNLYFVAGHNDCQHYHLHIGASRITLEGKCIDAWKDKTRCEKILRKLEEEYDLIHVTPSQEVERKAPSTGQIRRFRKELEEFQQGLRDNPPETPVLAKLQEAIALSITPMISMSDFLDRLAEKGVSTRIKISEEGEILGISYSLDGVAFAGRKLGRNKSSCTLSGLQQRGVTMTLNDLKSLLEHSNLKGEEVMAKIIHNGKNQGFLFPETPAKTQSRGIER